MSLLTFLNPANLFGKIVDKVGDYQIKKKEKEVLKVKTKAKLEMAKESNSHEVTLTDAEWESIAMSKSDSTWKDEYVTIIFTLPIPLILIGALVGAFTGDVTLLNGTLSGIEKLTNLGISWDDTTYAIVLAAVGLKVWRSGKQ